jgi:hypothetical protein
MKTRMMLLSVVAISICSAAWADGPFDGSWQMNASKSNLAGDTMTFEDAGNGSLKYADSNESYSFKPDGSSFTTPFGIERTFKKVSDSSYTTTNKKAGLLLNTSSWKLSKDGNTLVIEAKGTKPNGDTFDNVATYARTAPGTGLIGGWKSTKVKVSSPNTITIASSGTDVTLTISAIKATCHAKWDGKDYPATGPTVSEGLTLALTKTGAESFKLVEKHDGKAIAIINYHVAADGKTMNLKGTNGEGKEPFSEVLDKQT